MRRSYLPFLLLLSACSLYGDDPPDGDDAWAGAELPACDTVRHAFVIDELELPVDSGAAEDFGWDFDGDGTIDNQGGNIISAVFQATGVDLQGAVDEALRSDLVQIGMHADRCDEPAYTLLSLSRGVELDRTVDPPRLLAEQVTTWPAVATTDLPGIAIDGTSRFPAGQLVHASVDDWVVARELVVVVDEAWEVGLRGHIAAVVDGRQIRDVITRAFQRKITERIAEAAPCTLDACDDEVALTMLGIFDDNEDGEITLAEVQENSLVMTLLRSDVDTDGDGEEDSLSVGVGFHASSVELFLNDVGDV